MAGFCAASAAQNPAEPGLESVRTEPQTPGNALASQALAKQAEELDAGLAQGRTLAVNIQPRYLGHDLGQVVLVGQQEADRDPPRRAVDR